MDQELTYKWIQDRLRELHSGTISEQDRSRLVAISKDDPFVADALEGFQSHPDETHSTVLDTLAQKIRPIKRERRRWLIPNLTVTAIAASMILIVGTWAVIHYLDQNEESRIVYLPPTITVPMDTAENTIASNDQESKIKTAPDARVEKEEVKNEKIKSLAGPAETSTGHNQEEDAVVNSEEDSKTLAPEETVQPISPAVPEDKDVVTAPPAAAGNEQQLDDAFRASQKLNSSVKQDEGYYANQMDPAIMRGRVTGRVVDAQRGEPVVKAKIIVSYANQLFYPDIQGNFELFIPETEVVLQVTCPGYTDSTVVIHQGDENIVVGLQPGAIAPSMIIASANAKGPVSPLKNPAIESFINIHRYITSSSTLELTTEPSSARRTVTVTFKVSNDGHARNVTVLESSRDKTYDGEAVRLIESGPDWVCPGGEYPCVRRYTFYFR